MRDKVVIITGASSGIGKALAYELAHQGAKVVLAARNIEELLHIEQDLRQQGAEVLSVRTDVTKELACKELIEQAYARFGRIDALINNAGISMRALLEDLEPAVLRKVMDVNFWGTVYCSKFAQKDVNKNYYLCPHCFNTHHTMRDKVVIITGASSGIGKALAYELAHQGAKVVLAARNIEELLHIEQDLRQQGAEVLSVRTDVTKELACKELIEQAYARFGRIDALINNAGISMRALLEDLEPAVLRKVMDVNFWGTVYCSKYALPYLLESKGSLVGVISIAGFIGLPGRTGYAASKFAVRGFLNTVRIENMKKGLHVMVAAPGFTASNIRKTALNANGRQQGESPRNENKMMTAEKCAAIIVKGIRKRKREIIMTFVEGKLAVFLSKWLPGLVDRLSYSLMAKEPDSPFK